MILRKACPQTISEPLDDGTPISLCYFSFPSPGKHVRRTPPQPHTTPTLPHPPPSSHPTPTQPHAYPIPSHTLKPHPLSSHLSHPRCPEVFPVSMCACSQGMCVRTGQCSSKSSLRYASMEAGSTVRL